MTLPDKYYQNAIKDHLIQALILLEECPTNTLDRKGDFRRQLEDILTWITHTPVCVDQKEADLLSLVPFTPPTANREP